MTLKLYAFSCSSLLAKLVFEILQIRIGACDYVVNVEVYFSPQGNLLKKRDWLFLFVREGGALKLSSAFAFEI